MDRCIFILDRCTIMMDRCTFMTDRCTFMMDRCSLMDLKRNSNSLPLLSLEEPGYILI